MLTPKTRLLRVLDGKTVDRPPCVSPGGIMPLMVKGLKDEAGVAVPEVHTDASMMAALAEAFYDKGYSENYGVPFCNTVEAEAMGARVVMTRHCAYPYVDRWAFEDIDDWHRAKPINLESGRARVVLDAVRILAGLRDDVPIMVTLTGPTTVAASVMEFRSYFTHLRKNRELSRAYLGFVTGELARYGTALIEAGADVVMIADSLASREIMGPKLYEDHAVPYLDRLERAMREVGAHTIVHMSSHKAPVPCLPSSIQAHAFAFDSAAPLDEVRVKLPGRVIAGAISSYAIESKDVQEVRRQTFARMRDGADIVSLFYGSEMSVPPENVRAVCEAVLEVG